MQKAKMASKSLLGGHFYSEMRTVQQRRCQAASFCVAHHQYILHQVKIYFKQEGIIILFHLDPEHNCPHNLFMVHYPQPQR